MKQMIISKQIAYAAKVGGGTISGINELHLLDTGAIACFAEDNTILTAAGAATELTDKKRFYIAVGNQLDASKSILCKLIPRFGTDYKKTAYTAPVKQKKFVGNDGTTGGTALNIPTTPTVGDEGQVMISDTTDGMRSVGNDTKRYSTNWIAGDTAATFTARLITIINADIDAIVVAVGVATNTGISLEVKDANSTFEVSVNGLLQSATIEEKGGTIEGVSVAPTFGEGTYDQVVAMEDEANLNRGDSKSIEHTDKFFKTTSLAVSGVTYNIYTFYWLGKRATATGEQNTYTHEVKVAIPSSGTAPTTAFETIMAEVFGGMFSTSDQESGI
jgi:hypothetical protein